VVDFFDTDYTANGRCTFPLANIRHRSPSDVPRARYLLILNRSDHVIPGVARLRREQIPAFFMLGETKGTSAGGSAEAGKSLRVPGTNPFFFNDDAWQGNRLLELLGTTLELEAFVLNTGHVGGEGEGSKKVRIQDSSAIVQGIVEGSILWDTAFPESMTSSYCSRCASISGRGDRSSTRHRCNDSRRSVAPT
jgi:phosphoenolpyruvate carboxykinase (ATP)